MKPSINAYSFDIKSQLLDALMQGMGGGGGMRTLSKRKSDENFKTCSLKSLGNPVSSTGQFFRREIASFLLRCTQPKRG